MLLCLTTFDGWSVICTRHGAERSMWSSESHTPPTSTYLRSLESCCSPLKKREAHIWSTICLLIFSSRGFENWQLMLRCNQSIGWQAPLLVEHHLEQDIVVLTTMRTLSEHFIHTPPPSSHLSSHAFSLLLLPYHSEVRRE